MKVAAKELTALQRAMLDRKLGRRTMVLATHQAVEHFSQALSHLASLPAHARRGTSQHLEVSVRAFPAPASVGRGSSDSAKMDLAVARELSTICRSLTWLDYYADEERFALDGLIELYAGERSGDVLARVSGLVTLSAVLQMSG